MFRKFIERPILSTVISIIIVILGILGITTLPIAQYPDIAPPTVIVRANYQGANAATVLKSVIIPLEQQINGVEGMDYMSSSAGNDGSAQITVTFKQGVNPDIAAVNVQNLASAANALLPQEVLQSGVTVRKSQTSNVLIWTLNSTNPDYDQTFLQNYAAINIIPRMQRVTGVGTVTVFGSKNYSVRIWLDPQKMAAYGLVPSDISAVLAEQNLEAAPGAIGERDNQSFQYTLRYKGRLTTQSEFDNIIIKANPDGQMLKLKDVADVELLGSQSYTGNTFLDDRPSVGGAVAQVAGSNAQQVIDGCMTVLKDQSKFFPKGVSYTSIVNVNDFLSASIEKVLHTLLEAFILVFIVVFLFLQDWRSTLIPAISVPVAIVGTFFFLKIFGFTINLLTLFALILAVGMVVDDAIVVVEVVHLQLENGEKSPRRAAINGMSEIAGAIVSITLVMSAVFIPVSFITGSAGVFYQQFGLTLAIAIVLSAINALTLSPALCAIFLKPPKVRTEDQKNIVHRFYDAFNIAFTNTTHKYVRGVTFLIRRKWVAIGGIVLFGGLFAWLMATTPKAFVPNEDMGNVFSDIALPLGASQERTEQVLDEIEKTIKTMPEVENIMKISGRGMISGVGSNFGMIILKLKPWSERTKKGESQDAVIGQLYAKTAKIKDAKIIFFGRPTLQGFGNAAGFEMQLQDQKGGSVEDFNTVATNFINALKKRPEIQNAFTAFNPNFPQYMIDLNVPAIKDAGLTVSGVLQTIQGYYGGVYASNVNLFGQQYRVIYQAPPNDRGDLASFNKIMVRSANGTMAPLSSFVTLTKTYGPQSLSRFNMFTSITVNGTPNPGFSSGDALTAVEQVAAKELPSGYGYEFSGLTRQEVSAGSQTMIIFLLCSVFVYFLLAAQYESYMLPFAVMFSLPFGLAGAIFLSRIFGLPNSIYTQISLIMLIGLLAKNAILIVQFAHDSRKRGMSVVRAAVRGGQLRLRPILMTSFAFIFGLLPLAVANGAGAVGNNALGVAAIGGMLFGTIFGVFFVPVLYVIFQWLHDKVAIRNEESSDVPQLTD